MHFKEGPKPCAAGGAAWCVQVRQGLIQRRSKARARDLRSRFRPPKCYLGSKTFIIGIHNLKYFVGPKNSSWGIPISQTPNHEAGPEPKQSESNESVSELT